VIPNVHIGGSEKPMKYGTFRAVLDSPKTRQD
jgi:hypothetical protein